jgi:hypothetical protein
MKNSNTDIATSMIPKSQQMRHIVPDHPALTSRAVCRPSGTGAKTPWLWRALLPIWAAALVNLVACTTQSGSMSLQRKPLSGYVEMSQVQAAYIGSGNAGNGTLKYRGRTYPFTVGGLGVGGIGISKIEGRGLRTGAPPPLPGRVHSGPLWLCSGHCEHGRPVAEERKWCDHASSRKAARTDAESGRRRGRDPNEPVTPSVGCWLAARADRVEQTAGRFSKWGWIRFSINSKAV